MFAGIVRPRTKTWYGLEHEIAVILFFLFQFFSSDNFEDITLTKNQFLEKLFEIFLVWIDFMPARFGRLLWKFDKSQIRKVRIFWFFVSKLSFIHFLRYKAHKNRIQVEIARNFFPIHLEKACLGSLVRNKIYFTEWGFPNPNFERRFVGTWLTTQTNWLCLALTSPTEYIWLYIHYVYCH